MSFFDWSVPLCDHIRTSSLSVPICTRCLVQLLLDLEEPPLSVYPQIFLLSCALQCLCVLQLWHDCQELCWSAHCHLQQMSWPEHLLKVSECWDFYEEESKVLQKGMSPMLMFSRRYVATKKKKKSTFNKYPSQTASDVVLYCSKLFWWSCCFCLLNCGENMHILVSQE